MKVELTKEQIDFLSYLCYGVSNDYEHYSVEEQRKRENLASEIICALDDAIEE